MYLSYYKPYFRPHVWRIIIALIAMLLFTFFSMVSVPVVIPVLKLLFNEETAGQAQLLHDKKDDAPEGVEDQIRGFLEDAVLQTGPGRWAYDHLAGFQRTYLENAEAAMRFKGLLWVAGMLVLVTALKGVCEYIYTWLLSYAFFRVALDVRAEIFRHILNLDYKFFINRSTGELESRVQNDIYALRIVFQTLVNGAVVAPLEAIMMLAFLFWLSVDMTLLILLGGPVIAAIMIGFARIIRKYTRRQRKRMDQLNSVMEEAFRNFKLIQTYHTMDIEGNRFNRENDAIFRLYLKGRLAQFGASPVIETLGMICIAGILALGGHRIMLAADSPMDAATFGAYILGLYKLYKPVRQLSRINASWQQGRVSTERILDILSTRPEVVETPNAAPVKGFEREIEFRKVQFRYGDKQVLNDVSFTLKKGGNIAIVGRAGSGKTTLVNMLPRLIDPDGGSILLDGHDIREYRLNELRDLFGIVTQEVLLFNATVIENIAYGDSHPDLSRVEQAAKLAHAHEFIEQLGGGAGYETNIGAAGVKLSGGQRQRIAIARAIYRNPRILIFDEATSSLDEDTQRHVQDAIDNLLKNRTAIVIAHRLSTIQRADEILALDDGRIIERGTHQQLLAASGFYSRLYNLTGEIEK
ncbi:ABC transporter ATP-binding protein [Candidatus Sumerlaeota bacterium]|nr:ABC transporter ATP-binding protein [Candidatus Sumerlaeota bacterium]